MGANHGQARADTMAFGFKAGVAPAMTDSIQTVAVVPTPARLLTAAAYQRLADVPPELEWFANLGSKATRRAYEHALADFMRFAGLVRPEEMRSVTRSHVVA